MQTPERRNTKWERWKKEQDGSWCKKLDWKWRLYIYRPQGIGHWQMRLIRQGVHTLSAEYSITRRLDANTDDQAKREATRFLETLRLEIGEL